MNTSKELLEERRKVVRLHQQFTLEHASRRMERQFAFYDANLSNCFPEIPRSAYLENFRRMHLNRQLSFLDIELAPYPELLDIQGWDATLAEKLCRAPGIVCTYHTGSYRLINFLLASAKVPFSLLVSNRAYRREKQAMDQLYTRVMAHSGIEPDLALIDAEQPMALLQMARAVRSGRSLLVYIDGNTGTPVPDNGQRNLVEIGFGRQRMRVRVGMALLAHWLGIGIYPVLCQRLYTSRSDDGRLIRYNHLPAILPNVQETGGTFAAGATDTLYQHLAGFVAASPAQWEGWLNIQHQLVPNGVLPDEQAAEVGSNGELPWATYCYRDRPFLLHKPSYQSYPLDWTRYEQLKKQINGCFYG